MKRKSALILHLGNIYYDSRSMNLYLSLKERGYKVKVVAFDWQTPGFKTIKGEISVYKLKKRFHSVTFYLKFALILQYRLLFSSYSVCFAEDIYTLPFASVFNFFKRGKLIYDSRELYGYLAGLTKKKMLQSALKLIEKTFINSTANVLVTGEMDAAFLIKEYNINNIILLRNLPLYKKVEEAFDFRAKYNISKEHKILLYQGMVLHGRGLRLVFDILKKTDAYVLIILGHGENYNYYKTLARDKGIDKKIIFAGKIEQENLLNYTAGADAGVALIENVSLSYYYALPNKLFEYILAGIPVIVSNLPQMKKIVDEHKVGIAVDASDEAALIGEFNRFFENKTMLAEYKRNCVKAAEELNWQKEIEELFSKI